MLYIASQVLLPSPAHHTTMPSSLFLGLPSLPGTSSLMRSPCPLLLISVPSPCPHSEGLSLMRPLCPLPLLLLLTPWRVRLPHDTSVAPGLLLLVLFIALCGRAAAPFPCWCVRCVWERSAVIYVHVFFQRSFFLGNISPIDAYFLFSPLPHPCK